MLVFITILLYVAPKVKIDLEGSSTIDLNLGEEYVEKGTHAYLIQFGNKKEIPIEIENLIDNSKVGQYYVKYTAKHNNIIKNTSRIVNVIDKEGPVITLNKEIIACKNNNIIDIDATVIDNYDGDITDNLKYQIKDDKIILLATDSSNNETVIQKDLTYHDSDKPVITLKGNSVIYLSLNSTYEEEGASAYDNCEGDLTDKIEVTSDVNTSIIGEYTVTYKVKDILDNEVIMTRKVIVTNNEYTGKVTNGVIYLTFDDGPGAYTENILSILDKNNIKATFFVTNQMGSKYQYLIKKEYEAGHTVGIHTYSHKWSIYDSVQTYLDDFEKIQNVVIEQTGTSPKYFRFPGGTSNHVATVSMKNLAELMTERGYIYFDWHIDSGDTHKNNTVSYIVNLVKKNLKGNGEYIILMHDIKKNTMNTLEDIINYAKSRGYTFKKIDDNTTLKQFKPYK